MAAEKLSARQKMIGMMYLVLTALLALQVSSGVLDKFVLINKSLEQSIASKMKENAKSVERIQRTVNELGNREKDIEVFNAALGIAKETKQVVGYIDRLKNKLITLTGGKDPKTGRLKGVKDAGVVARVMINARKGVELQKLLNGYMKYLSKSTGNHYAPIALDAKDSELFRKDPNQASKNFTTLNFDHTPLGAALATLSQFSSEVVYAETHALEALARSVGAEDVKFDKLAPLVKPQSNIVAAGARYKAELFLAASSSGVSPKMSINGRPIKVEDGVGTIDFVASPGKYNKNGLSKKVFKAAIKLKNGGGKESIIEENIEYYVAKPVIQIQSAAVQALYLNCGNELNVRVPALGMEYNPSFRATGADVVAGGAKGLVTLIPKANEVKLDVYSNKNLVGTQTFQVRKIPRPEIVITSKGKKINAKRGMPAPGPRGLEVKVVPDESFKAFLPKDALYRVAKWEVSLARGSRALKTKTVNSQKVSLNDFASFAKSGDRIVIEVKKIERRNFKGEVENVNIGTIVYTIPLN